MKIRTKVYESRLDLNIYKSVAWIPWDPGLPRFPVTFGPLGSRTL